MQDKSSQSTATARSALDEFQLRDELRTLRARIPDEPQLNPILNVAFDLSRRLEAGQIDFAEFKALAGRLMDRAAARRAIRLRDRIGHADTTATLKEFASFVEASLPEGGDAGAGLAALMARWDRARTGIVLTAHPTFGLSEALTRRMVEIAASGESAVEARVGHPHRPDEGVDLAYEHARAQEALQNMRNAYLDLLNAFLSVSAQRFGAEAYKTRPTLTTLACWVGYDLDGRTDIKWSHSFLIRLQEKRAALIEMRERFLVIRHRLGDSDKTLRLFRQITGKLDLAVAAVDEQVRALSNV
ncbi:MAG: phosphoenolpyruvate carboxylase, partial [Hyphomicrobium sp.]